MIRAVILDFDGVIVDSVDIKSQAFVHLFRGYPEKIKQQIVKLHVTNSGLSRHEKFKIIYERILDRMMTEEEVEELAAEFSRFCLRRITVAPYIKGAYEFISTRHTEYTLYLASSTPETELQAIVKRRGIRGYFKGVYGTPPTKVEACRRIIEKEALSPNNAVLVGDSLTDLEASRQCGLHFIARLDQSSKDPLLQEELRFKLADLINLHEFLITNFR